MNEQTFSTEIGGKTLTATFNDLADQTNGSVILSYGKTVVLATAVMSDSVSDLPYFPLKVDYEEKFYAAGQILGSRFMRREGRPSEDAILSGRVVDRTIRPLFNQKMRNDIQVIITVLSIDEDDPDVLGVIAASLALATSDIPWNGPVAAIRVGKTHDGQPVINPTYFDREEERLAYDVLVCGRDGNINMLETEAKEIGEDEIGNAFDLALKELAALQKFQEDIVAKIGKEKRVVETGEVDPTLVELFEKEIKPRLRNAVICGEAGKQKSGALKQEWKELVKEQLPEANMADADDLFEDASDEELHRAAVEEDKRADGRGFGEVRALVARAGGMAPMLHGSGVFYRGGTHVFTALTLGGPEDSLIVDSIEEPDSTKRFMHHYNFPPFSVGETGRLGGLNRRAVGHGALAEKALRAVIPRKEDFPYTIRLVSESMASNGSTSMASVCASTLALMDGGVPIKRPVAGIAMGLMMMGDKYKILTDIQGPEDHHGDMDFKVAGTREGITAIQMDIKVGGIPVSILKEALQDAKKAREHILDTIEGEISEPRPDIAAHAPRIAVLTVPVKDIGLVIGPGGKTINGIKDETGVTGIQIEEDGTVFITGVGEGVEQARQRIADMTRTYEKGERFEGEVVRIADFGAFVKLNDHAEGLVHVSEIAPFRVEKVTDVLSVGQRVPVMIKNIDEQDRISLSIKSADPDFIKPKDGGSKSTTEK